MSTDEARRHAENTLHWIAWAMEEVAHRINLLGFKVGRSQAQRAAPNDGGES